MALQRAARATNVIYRELQRYYAAEAVSSRPADREALLSKQIEATQPTIELGEQSLRINTPLLQHHALSYVWLRDACTSATSIDPSTRQKLFKTSDIPSSIRPVSCGLIDDGTAIEIEWDQCLRGQRGRDRSRFSLDYLARHLSPTTLKSWHSDDSALPIIWDCASLARQDMWMQYDHLDRPEVLLEAIERLLSFGIVFFRGVPHRQRNDNECELNTLAAMLGDIRRTWYGDKVWDVKSVANAKNIAYTNLDLGLHMDLLHYSNPPRFQLLHYLHSHPSLRGGESYFVDAFRAAADLRRADPVAYETLSTLPVAFEYRNGGHWRHSERPTLEHDQQGMLSAVNYSPPFQAPLPLYTPQQVQKLHDALSLFAERIEDSDLRYTIQLQPGDCVAFDNQRVLHARTGFSWDEEAVAESGEAGRHLKGCYVEGDSIRDRFRVLRAAVNGSTL